MGTAYPVQTNDEGVDLVTHHPGVISKNLDVQYFRIEANSPYLDGNKIASLLSQRGFPMNKVMLVSVTSVMTQTTLDQKDQNST